MDLIKLKIPEIIFNHLKNLWKNIKINKKSIMLKSKKI